MVDAGADANATERYGYPVIRSALLLRDTKTVQALIEKRGNTNWKDVAGYTPLGIATILHNWKMLSLLKRTGATDLGRRP